MPQPFSCCPLTVYGRDNRLRVARDEAAQAEIDAARLAQRTQAGSCPIGTRIELKTNSPAAPLCLWRMEGAEPRAATLDLPVILPNLVQANYLSLRALRALG